MYQLGIPNLGNEVHLHWTSSLDWQWVENYIHHIDIYHWIESYPQPFLVVIICIGMIQSNNGYLLPIKGRVIFFDLSSLNVDHAASHLYYISIISTPVIRIINLHRHMIKAIFFLLPVFLFQTDICGFAFTSLFHCLSLSDSVIFF